MARQPPLLWPWPFAAAAAMGEAAVGLAGEMTRAFAPPAEPPAPLPWITPNRIALTLPTMHLRDVSTPAPSGHPTLIDAPFAVHTAVVADLAPGHSLIAALHAHGVDRLHVTDWLSATPAMRDFTIDTYLADLNVAVDEIGPPVDLIGLCQGGWMALVYAARFPAKVRRLVLVGAPIDTSRGHGPLVDSARATPLPIYGDLVRFGGGRLLGGTMQQQWASELKAPHRGADALQLAPGGVDAALAARFAAWDDAVVDLPGPFFLQVVAWLYKDNRLAAGTFPALGRSLDLASVRHPLYLLAGAGDLVCPPEQVLAAADLVGTRRADVHAEVVPGVHLALFMGRTVLATAWPRIAAFLTAPAAAPAHRSARRRRA